MNSRVYALANQKGGVGKTTTAINMAACVAEAGTPVLLIDLDPQANATTGLGFRPDQLELSTYDLLHGSALDDVVVETAVPNLCLAPSHPDLAAAQVELCGRSTPCCATCWPAPVTAIPTCSSTARPRWGC